MLRRFLKNYLRRHQNRTNQALHVLGVPMSFVVAPLLALGGAPWYLHVSCFVTGYLLQFVGHAGEGNDAGEVVFVKRMLGLPYNEYAPGTYSSSDTESPDDTNSACS